VRQFVASYKDDHQLLGRDIDNVLRAAEFATELGRRDTVAHLLREVAPLELSVSSRARRTWIEDAFDDGIRDPADGAVELADLAEQVAVQGEVDLALRLLPRPQDPPRLDLGTAPPQRQTPPPPTRR